MKKIIKQLIIVSIAIGIMSVSINMFLSPHRIAAGGVSGIGVLLEKSMGIDRSIIVLALNAVMLILAFVFLGKGVFIKSAIGSFMLPLGLGLVPEIMLVKDQMLSVVAGSVLFAVAVTILYKNEFSSGGTTIPPLIFKKYFGTNTSLGLFITDMIVVVFNIFIFGIESFLFAIISLIITSSVMTYIETGMRRKKAVMIMRSEKMEEIRQRILDEKDYSVSLANTSMNDKSEQSILIAIVEDAAYPKLINAIDEIDKGALAFSCNIAKIHGLEDHMAAQKAAKREEKKAIKKAAKLEKKNAASAKLKKGVA